MISDALEGHIDLIITKSVSRFARNTVDSLSTIRSLKDHGVEVYFEKENIWTFDGKGEVLLTIMSSLAQEEARSTSENCKWGIRKRYAEGKFSLPYSHFLGYDKGPDGNPVINKEQAALVKRIFTMFLEGASICRIARDLTDENIPTPSGKKKWCVGTVKGILRNEKYKGDVLLQKTYIPDFLTKKQVRNNGSVQQYYIKGNHEPIISEEIFDAAQSLLDYRANHKTIINTKHPFSGLIFCSHCGGLYGPRIWHSNNRYRKIVWICNSRSKNDNCFSKTINDEVLEQAFLEAAGLIIKDKNTVIQNLENRILNDFNTEPIEKELACLELKNEIIITALNDMVISKSSSTIDSINFEEKYSNLEKEYDHHQREIDKLNERKTAIIVTKQKLKLYLKYLSNIISIEKFNEKDLRSMVDKIITDGEILTFIFKDGKEVALKESDLLQPSQVLYPHHWILEVI